MILERLSSFHRFKVKETMLLDVDPSPPSFADASSLVSQCLAEVRFPEEVLVTEATRRHRRLANPRGYSGPWYESPHDMGALDRPMDCLAAGSGYREVIVEGPTQTGKSEIGNNWALQTVLYDQADMLTVGPNENLMKVYVTTQFDKMLDAARSEDDTDADSPLRERQLSGPSSDNITLKQFRGCDLHFGWPSGSTFRARPISRGRLDDYDEMPSDIDAQGDALGLLLGRDASFSAFGETKAYVNSTPKLGRNKGIEGLRLQGTNEKLYVDCLACGEPFQLDSSRLTYDRCGTAAEAAESAGVLCPDESCGGIHVQTDKKRLLATKRWVGEGEAAVSMAEVQTGKVGELVPNSRASFKFDGLFGMRPWANMAEMARNAEIKFEREQDEGGLKTWDQTVAGRNYDRRNWPHLFPETEEALAADAIVARARLARWKMREVPPGVQCLIASIDQQVNRFEVAVWGWGNGFRSWLIDRFCILVIEQDGRERPLKPFTRPEDFAVLYSKVLEQTYPLAGAPHLRMKIFNTVLDTGGLDNATDNAFDWWYSMVVGDVGSGRRPVPQTAITLYKGGNNPKGKLLPTPTPDTKRQIKGAPQAELYIPNTNRIKDVVDIRLNRREDAPGFINFGNDVDEAHIAEMRAEYKVGDQWTRDRHVANETGDLYIMAYTAVLRFGAQDGSLSWVPGWARPPRGAPAKLEAPVVVDDGQLDPAQVVKSTARSGQRSVPSNRGRRGVRVVRPR